MRKIQRWKGGSSHGFGEGGHAPGLRARGTHEEALRIRDVDGQGQVLCLPVSLRPYLTPSSSTSKISVAFGGITPPAPRAP